LCRAFSDVEGAVATRDRGEHSGRQLLQQRLDTAAILDAESYTCICACIAATAAAGIDGLSVGRAASTS